MKQFVLILCLALVASCVRGQGYVINGEVKGADGQTVSLKQFRNLQPVEVGTAKVASGKFTLKGTTPYPEFCQLYVGDQGPIQFFVENANIRIVIDLQNLEKTKVTGSKENDIFTELVNGLDQYAQQQKQLNDSYTAMSSSSVATPDAVANIRTQMEKLNADRLQFTVNFVLKYPGRIATAFVVDNLLMQVLNVEQLEQVAGGFGAKTGASPWVQILKENVSKLKRTAIGQPFPDITLKTPDDKPVSLSDYAGKGKYVLIDFWASWCGPCRNANPQVVALYRQYKDKGFEIVGVSLDRGKKEWVEAIKNDQLIWPHMSDLGYWQSAAAKLYSVSSIPYTVLLDKNGKIIAKGLHVGELRTKLAELMD